MKQTEYSVVTANRPPERVLEKIVDFTASFIRYKANKTRLLRLDVLLQDLLLLFPDVLLKLQSLLRKRQSG